ncbi:MAG: hypothetical protein CMJ75_21835 [Planctomycetaceae bacterium]|nr:hypothetical protein [Planctomycetaceae bacterium]
MRRNVILICGLVLGIMRLCVWPSIAAIATEPTPHNPVDVRDFGAVADGVTDCLPAIQRALDQVVATGGVVSFPASDKPYLVRGTIQVRTSDTVLAGAGATIKLADGVANGTRQQRTTESQVHVIHIAGTSEKPVQRVQLLGLAIDANIYQQADYYNPRAVVTEYASQVLVRDVKILRAFVGLDFGAGSSHCEARDCVIEDWTEDAFDASGDADKGSGAVTRHITFVRCHARNAPNSTGNAWEIEDGVRHIRVVDCSVCNVPRGNAFGIRNHWTAGPVDVSRDIELRRVRITAVGGKYGIYSHSAPRDQFPQNRLVDVRLYDVVCEAPVLFYGPLERVEIEGGRFGALHFGWDYGAKNRPEPGGARPLQETHVRIRNTRVNHLDLNATAGEFTLQNVLVFARGEQGRPQALRIRGGAGRVRIVNCTMTGARNAGLDLRQGAAPQIVNSIIWGNAVAFRVMNSRGTLSHCCIQGGVPETLEDQGANFSDDPLFISGAYGPCYLASASIGQDAASPCVDAGSELAAFTGLDEWTTRSDNLADTGTVDVGFHHRREPPRKP